MINILVVLGLSKEVEAINVGLKVQLIHCLRLIVRTILQLFFNAFSSFYSWSSIHFGILFNIFSDISLMLCV
jgi:hypothetical protein